MASLSLSDGLSLSLALCLARGGCTQGRVLGLLMTSARYYNYSGCVHSAQVYNISSVCVHTKESAFGVLRSVSSAH